MNAVELFIEKRRGGVSLVIYDYLRREALRASFCAGMQPAAACFFDMRELVRQEGSLMILCVLHVKTLPALRVS